MLSLTIKFSATIIIYASYINFNLKGLIIIVKISVLDYAVIDEGKDAVTAVKEAIELAQHAEALNFSRFFVAEHHDVKSFASSSPELLMMKLLDETNDIQIGSAGVMLPHYSPLKVAENFRMLEAFHCGRVNLGFGNTFGTAKVQRAMDTKKADFDYEHHIDTLQQHLTNASNITVHPETSSAPSMWMLSTSERSAKLAAKLGVGYIFGLFPYASTDKIPTGRRAIKQFKEMFQPSKTNETPVTIAAVFVVISDTDEKAETLANALDVWLLGKNNFNEFEYFPSVETAKAYDYTDDELKRMKANRTRMVVGSKETVKAKLLDIQNELSADELLIIPLMPGFNNRKHALTLIHEAFNL